MGEAKRRKLADPNYGKFVDICLVVFAQKMYAKYGLGLVALSKTRIAYMPHNHPDFTDIDRAMAESCGDYSSVFPVTYPEVGTVWTTQLIGADEEAAVKIFKLPVDWESRAEILMG
jgi:hypothetical protein